MPTTFRADLRAGCKTVLDSVKTANPTRLAHTYAYPPGSFHTPAAWVAKEMSEALQHTSGVRFRRVTATVVVANKQVSNEQATDEQDALLDLMLDAFTAAPHAASAQTLIEPVAVRDREIDGGGGAIYAGFEIDIAGLIQEGR